MSRLPFDVIIEILRSIFYFYVDIFYTYANEAKVKSGTVLSPDEVEKLLDSDHNLGDWLLYQHFNKSFWERVENETEFHDEVTKANNSLV